MNQDDEHLLVEDYEPQEPTGVPTTVEIPMKNAMNVIERWEEKKSPSTPPPSSFEMPPVIPPVIVTPPSERSTLPRGQFDDACASTSTEEQPPILRLRGQSRNESEESNGDDDDDRDSFMGSNGGAVSSLKKAPFHEMAATDQQERTTDSPDDSVNEQRSDDYEMMSSNDDDNDSVKTQESLPSPECRLHSEFHPPQFDESYSKFFLSKPVLEEEIKETSESIYKKMDQVLKTIEQEGPEAYESYKQQKKSTTTKEPEKVVEEQEGKALLKEQALEAAMIKGSPRDYQVALFEIAKTRNTIVHLGTGKGKTLIALLCIEHFACKSNNKNKNQTLFLVPSVALALQQSNTLRANLPYTVQTACRSMVRSDKAREQLSQAHVLVATHGAMHDLLMHYGDLFSLSNYRLVVFDECHYAHGNHHYKTILEKWYKPLSEENRPHILGLTASPLINVKHTHSDEQLGSMLETLEETLDSQLATVKSDNDNEEGEDVATTAMNAAEKQVRYFSAHEPTDFPPHDLLPIHDSRPRELNQLIVLYQELGPLAVSVYCESLQKEVSCNVFEGETQEQFECLVHHLGSIAEYCKAKIQACPPHNGGRTDKLIKLDELLQKEVVDNDQNDAVGLVFVQRRITAMALHAYLRRNVTKEGEQNHRSPQKTPSPEQSATSSDNDIKHTPIALCQFEDADDDCLEGILKRTVSEKNDNCDLDQFADADEDDEQPPREVYEPLREEDEPKQPPRKKLCPVDDQFTDAEEDETHINDDPDRFKNGIRCGVLVRQPTQIFKYLNSSNRATKDTELLMEKSEQEWLHQEMKIRETLNSLRKKEINVLIATSIVEEGVDVQACSFVAVFDPITTTKSYIQMKGRARQKSARFFLFLDGQDVKAVELSRLQGAAQRVHSFIEGREDRHVSPMKIPQPIVTRPVSDPLLTAELQAVQQGEYRAQHGTVDLKSAKSLLNRYVLNIPIDSTARATKEALLLHMPTFGEHELVLPAHLPVDARKVSLPPQYAALPSSEKQQILSLMACVRLHERKLLNERLLPLRKKDLTQEVLRVAKNQVDKTTPYAASVNTLFASGKREVFLYPIVVSGEKLSQFEDVLTREPQSLVLVSCEKISAKVDCESNFYELGELQCKLGSEIPFVLDTSKWDICTDFFSVLFSARWRRKTKGESFRGRDKSERQEVLAPYVVGLLDGEGRLDWETMKRVVLDSNRLGYQRGAACRSYEPSRALTVPRLCNPAYNLFASYIVLGPTAMDCSEPFPGSIEGVTTFRDYFMYKYECEVPEDDKLFLAQRLWQQPSGQSTFDEMMVTHHDDDSLPNGISQDTIRCPGLPTVLLPQSLCREATLADPHLLMLAAALPQFLFELERRMVVKSFLRYCEASFPSLGNYLSQLPQFELCSVFTAKSVDVKVNYDKFEWFGDAVLKLLQTDALLSTPELRLWVQHLHEGDLSNLRSAMCSNEYLRAACQRIGFEKFVATVPLSRGKWRPRHLESHFLRDDDEQLPKQSAASVSPKVCADIMEALLGAVYIYHGYDAAAKVGLECGLLLPQGDGLSHLAPHHVSPRSMRVDAATTLTGRPKFNYPGLIEEAFTHPSALHEQVPSYQRLEWIGDAVLCIAVREWIFRTFPHLVLGDMVTLDAAMVSNEVLGYQCYKTSLHKLINHRDQSLPSKVEHYEWTIAEVGRGFWGSHPPKILPDVVEALFGAAHVDGGFESGQVAVKTLMRPIFEAVHSLGGEAAVNAFEHPMTKLTEIGGRLFEVEVHREHEFLRRLGESEALWQGSRWRKARLDGGDSAAAVRSMGGNLIAAVEPSWKSARNRACALAVAVLEQNPGLVKRWKEAAAVIDRHLSHEEEEEGRVIETRDSDDTAHQ